jgi:hypothetical protein
MNFPIFRKSSHLNLKETPGNRWGRTHSRFLMVGSIPNRKPLAAVLRFLQFVDGRNGIVLHGNPTVAARVYDQIVFAETEFPSPLAGFKEPRRGKIGPIRAADYEVLANLLMSLGDRQNNFWKMADLKKQTLARLRWPRNPVAPSR